MESYLQKLFLNTSKILELLSLEMSQSLKGKPRSAGSSLIKRNLVVRLSDTQIFSHILDEATYKLLVAGSLSQLFKATFAIRHRLAELSYVLHRTAAVGKMTACPGFAGQIPDESPFAGSDWWNMAREQRLLPVVGFSALGSHLSLQEEGRCRAFDFYDILSCNAPAEDGVFCEEHRAEKWWIHPIPKGASVQAKMFSYYTNLSNIEEYEEEELRGMVRMFWKKIDMKLVKERPTHKQVEKALKYFGYRDVSSDTELSLAGLKRRYWSRAKRLHPDRGGSEEQFRVLGIHYEILRSYVG